MQDVGHDTEAFDDVFKATADLRTVHDKSYLDLDNIEHLFAAIETGLLIGRFSTRTIDQIEGLRASIIKLITRTLQRSVKFPIRSGTLRPPPPYDKFLSALQTLIGSQPTTDPHNFTFITFNYDLVLDLSLGFVGYTYDYCLDDAKTTARFPLLKLHGSVSWGVCTKCENKIISLDLKSIKANPLMSDDDIQVDIIDLLAKLKCPQCQQPLQGPPVLVPPTWNKTEYQSHLAKVWRRAAVELGKADNIIVIGYSMPKTDSFFHYLYALGSESETKLQHFIVINPDKSVEGRFKEILGPGIQKQFQFIPGGFANNISYLASVLGS